MDWSVLLVRLAVDKLSLVPSYDHEPNFILQRWSSNGNQRMSMAHDDMKIPSGFHVQLPSESIFTSVRNLVSIASCALSTQTASSSSSLQIPVGLNGCRICYFLYYANLALTWALKFPFTPFRLSPVLYFPFFSLCCRPTFSFPGFRLTLSLTSIYLL